MFWTYYHKPKSFDKKLESPAPPSTPMPSLAELADNVTQSWSEGDITWAAVHWEIGTIGLGRWGQPCLECYKTVKNTREYQRWLMKRNGAMSNHDLLSFNIASDVSLTPKESVRRPPNSHTDVAPTQPRQDRDDTVGWGETGGLSYHCRIRGITEEPPTSCVSFGLECEDHQPVHCISGQEELDRESTTGPSSAGGSAPRRRSFVAKTRIVNLSELYPGFPIPESTLLQPSAHVGGGDTRVDAGDVHKGDVVNDVVMSLLHKVCDAEVVTEQQVGKDGTEGLGCLAYKTMPTDNISESEREGPDATTSSSSIAGSDSSDTMPESAAEIESLDTIPPESTAESEFMDTTPPESTAKSESPDTMPPESTTESEFLDTIPPKSTAESEFPNTIPPESTAETEFPDTVPPESTAETEFPDTIPPESTTESESPDTIPPESTIEREFPYTIPPESTVESVPSKRVCTIDCEASDIVTITSSVVGTGVFDTMQASTALRESTGTTSPDSTTDMESSILGTTADRVLCRTVSESTAEGELCHTVSESASRCEPSDIIPPDSAEGESSYAILESTTENASSDSIAVSNVETESIESVATDESELSDSASEGTIERESDMLPLSVFERESSSYTIPESTDEREPYNTTLRATKEGEASDKAISLPESGSIYMKPESVAEVFTEVGSQSPEKMAVAIVDTPQLDQANPPVLYLECIEALDAVIDEHDGDRLRVGFDNPQLHTNSPVEFSDELSREGPHAYQHSDHVVSFEAVMNELESRGREVAETSCSISPKTSSTDSGTVAVMFGRDVDPAGSTSQDYSDESERDSEWPEATLSVSDDVVSCPQRSTSPLEASVGILRLSYSSPCVLLTSPYREPSPDGAEPSCPVDQELEENFNSSSSSSEALICKPSGDASELYASDVSFVFDMDGDDGDDDECDESYGDVDADDVHYDVGDGVDGYAVMVDNVEGKGKSVSFDLDPCELESGVFKVDDDDANSANYVCDDIAVDSYDNVKNAVEAAGGVDFHVNFEADFDADAITNVEAYVVFGVSADVDAVDAVAYSLGSNARVDVDANINDNVGSDEVKVCVALHVEFDADTHPHSDVEDDGDFDVVPAADVDADDADAEVEADPVDAVYDINAVSDTNIDVNVPTNENDGLSSFCDMDRKYNYTELQQQQQPVIITNINGPTVTSNVPVATTSSTTGGSSPSGNSHFLLDKSFTDSDLDISVINLDNEPPNPDPLAAIPDNPPSESTSTDTLQFSSLISESDFEVPCQTRSDTSTSTASQISPGLREGCYLS